MVLEAKKGPFVQPAGYKQRAAEAVKLQDKADRRAVNMMRARKKTNHFFTEGYPAPVDQTVEDTAFLKQSGHHRKPVNEYNQSL